jgi:hypothetical protein
MTDTEETRFLELARRQAFDHLRPEELRELVALAAKKASEWSRARKEKAAPVSAGTAL